MTDTATSHCPRCGGTYTVEILATLGPTGVNPLAGHKCRPDDRAAMAASSNSDLSNK